MDSAPDFNRLARLYRWMEYLTFGPFLWRCRVHFLGRLGDCRNALILGDGDGRFTARLLDTYRDVRIHAIDASPRMIEALQRASRVHRERLFAEVADLRAWRPSATGARCDLVATHFFLDCLTTGEVADLIRRIRPVIAPGAHWVVSEFAIPPTAFGRMLAAPLVHALYAAFRLLTGLRVGTLPDYRQALMDSGWSLQEERRLVFGLLVSQLWHFHAD